MFVSIPRPRSICVISMRAIILFNFNFINLENRHICFIAHCLEYGLFWMIMSMKKVNNYQIAKVQAQGVAQLCLIFCQFQPDVAYKVVGYKGGYKGVDYSSPILMIFFGKEDHWMQTCFRKIFVLCFSLLSLKTLKTLESTQNPSIVVHSAIDNIPSCM